MNACSWLPRSISSLLSFGLLSAMVCADTSVDPDLEPGFPVQSLHIATTGIAGPGINTLIGNIDDRPDLEIVVSGFSAGLVYAWKHDGTPAIGWPNGVSYSVGYLTLGNLSGDAGTLEVFTAHYGDHGIKAAFSGSGDLLPGWPQSSSNYITSPGSMLDVDGDGVDEIFICQEDGHIHAFHADGRPALSAPIFVPGGQRCFTPTLADIDGDGDTEIITSHEPVNNSTSISAFHLDGTRVSGFPVSVNPRQGNAQTYSVVGDVDGDGEPEIVVVARENTTEYRTVVLIIGGGGVIERELIADQATDYGTAPALADMDFDGVPEIIVQTRYGLYVWRGDGTLMPGWPAQVPARLSDSAPVVGDVDGDGYPNIVVTGDAANSDGKLFVFNHKGQLHHRFPKTLPMGTGAVPAIADIDLDGRNEIIVSGSYWNGISGFYDKVWVYDLSGSAHGEVWWGQFAGGSRHQGVYQPKRVAPPDKPNERPVVVLNVPASAVRNSPFTLSAANSYDVDGDRLEYRWDLGNGVIRTGGEISHSYPGSGTYQVTVTASDGKDYSQPATVTVVVSNLLPVADAGGPYTVPRRTIFYLDGSRSYDPNQDSLDYRWSVNNGSVILSGVQPSYYFYEIGTYPISLTVHDGEGESSPASTTVTVVNALPTSSAGPDQTVLAGDVVYLDGSASYDKDGSISRYQWRQISGPTVRIGQAKSAVAKFGAPSVGGGQPVTIEVELTVTDNDGGSSSDRALIIVNPK